MLNRFYLLSKIHPGKMDRIPTKIKWKTHALFILYFKFWRYGLIIFKIEPPDLLFLVVFISFYVIRFLELHSILSVKKISFLTDSLKPPHPINGQNMLSVTSFLLMLPRLLPLGLALLFGSPISSALSWNRLFVLKMFK